MSFLDSNKFHRSPEVLSCTVGDILVLLDIGQGLYFSLDLVAAAIWSVLEKEASFPELVSAVSSEFDSEPDIIKPDIALFLGQMIDNKLLLVN